MTPRKFLGPTGEVIAVKTSDPMTVKVSGMTMRVKEGFWLVGSPIEAVYSDEAFKKSYFGDHTDDSPKRGTNIRGLDVGR